MLVVIAMFWKGIEVLGPSNTNYTIKYDGPKKTTEQRWNAAFEWIERKRNDKPELKALDNFWKTLGSGDTSDLENGNENKSE